MTDTSMAGGDADDTSGAPDADEAKENEPCPTCGAMPAAPCRTAFGVIVPRGAIHTPRLMAHRAHKKKM